MVGAPENRQAECREPDTQTVGYPTPFIEEQIEEQPRGSSRPARAAEMTSNSNSIPTSNCPLAQGSFNTEPHSSNMARPILS